MICSAYLAVVFALVLVVLRDRLDEVEVPLVGALEADEVYGAATAVSGANDVGVVSAAGLFAAFEVVTTAGAG